MAKRGQASQVFIYAITAIVIGLVVFLGYKGISALTESGSKAELTKFKNDFKNMIDTGSSFGRKETHDLFVPGSWDEICFVDESNIKNKDLTNSNITNALIIDSVETGSDENVFLVREKTTIDSIRTDPLELPSQYKGGFCTSIPSGKIKLRLEGKGDRTFVSVK